MEIPYEESDFPLGKWKVIQCHGDFLDGIQGIVYHYKNEPIYDENGQYQRPELESSHPWATADIVCCERCKELFDI